MADTAKRIAEIYQIPLEELAETTTNNVKSLFKI
jgi:Tat protein secretion system quality control protein TatD with DNase activity